MAKEYIDKVGEGRIAEGQAFVYQVFIEGSIVVVYHVADDGNILLLGLQDDETAMVLAAGTSADLRHHHEGMLVGTEVRHVQHRIGIDDAHHRHLVEVQPLRYHLGTDEDIRPSGTKVADDALIGIAGTRRVEVHTGDAGLREGLTHLFLYLLRTIASCPQVCRTATGTFCGHSIGEAAVVACQLIHLAVQRQFHVAVLTRRHPATLSALYLGGEATAVLEQDGLFTMLQGLTHTR